MDGQLLIQERLRQRFMEVTAKNSRVSVRSFAKQINIPASTVSLLMLGKRKVSLKLALKIADALSFDPVERTLVNEAFENDIKKKSKRPSKSPVFASEKMRLSADQFYVVKDWHYLAILNLIQTQSYQHNEAWIAKRLNLTPAVVKEALNRLKRLKLFEVNQNGKVVRRYKQIRTTDGIKDPSLRYSHFQSLELASDALQSTPLDSLAFTWVTLPVNIDRVPEMRLMIRKFNQEFLEKFGEETAGNEVGRLNVSFFPLTKPQTQTKESSDET